LSKEYPENLQVRNGSLIHKKFISGKVPCEVSVVVKCTAGAQNSVVLKRRGAQTAWCSNSVVLKRRGAQTVWCSNVVVLKQCGAQTAWCSKSKSTLYLEIIKIRRKLSAASAKMSKQCQCVFCV